MRLIKKPIQASLIALSLLSSTLFSDNSTPISTLTCMKPGDNKGNQYYIYDIDSSQTLSFWCTDDVIQTTPCFYQFNHDNSNNYIIMSNDEQGNRLCSIKANPKSTDSDNCSNWQLSEKYTDKPTYQWDRDTTCALVIY